jgi:hypothetical protein
MKNEGKFHQYSVSLNQLPLSSQPGTIPSLGLIDGEGVIIPCLKLFIARIWELNQMKQARDIHFFQMDDGMV